MTNNSINTMGLVDINKDIFSFRMLVSVVLLGTMIAACSTDTKRMHVVDSMDEVLADAIASNTDNDIPDSVSQALIPAINLSSTKLPELADDERFDISVNNVAADQFFLSLVDGTQFNIVVHPEVSGTISLNLSNVSIPDVLEAVRDVYGYEFVSTPYGFQVLPGRLQARIYQINYLNVRRTGESATLVSTGTLTSGGSSRRNNSNNNSGNFNNETGSGGGSGSVSAFGTQIRTIQPEANFWDELQASVSAIVGQGEGRNVVVNPMTGVVVVRALPTELREVETYLRATQLIVQRQVILEAKILEVRLNEDFQTGINWSTLLKPGNNTITASHIGGGSVLVNESGASDIAGSSGTLNPAMSSIIDGAVTSAFGGVFSLALNFGDFTSFIELLETQGNVQILSSPRVSTINNQKAVIKVGRDEYFVTDISSNQSFSSNTATTIIPDITLTPFFSGIALDVTPQISGDGYVTLHVHPSISDVVDQQKRVTIGSVVQEIPLALSTVRETDSIVRARSGQMIVIGGLMQDIIIDEDAGAPGLKDIPFIGGLFKHTKRKSIKSELVILLRPIIVESDNEWRGAIQQTADSLNRLRRQLN